MHQPRFIAMRFEKLSVIFGTLLPLCFQTGCATPEDTALLGGVFALATGSPNLTAAQSVAYQAASATAFETARLQAQQRAAQAGQPKVTVNNFTPTAPAPVPASSPTPAPAPPPKPKPLFESLSGFVTPDTGKKPAAATDANWVVEKFSTHITGTILPVGFAELTGDKGVFTAHPTQLHFRANQSGGRPIFIAVPQLGLDEFREIKPGEDFWLPLAGPEAKAGSTPARVEFSLKYWKPGRK